MPRLARLYTWSVTVIGAVILARSVWEGVTDPPGIAWVVLAALTLLGGSLTLRMPVAPVSFSISDTFTITAALLFGPASGTVAVAIDGLAISARLRREHRSVERVLFNATAPPLAMW